MESIRVLGLGNVLMGDDAFGPTVVKVLEARYEFDTGVSVQDIGTPGLNLLPYVSGIDALIVVDTVRADGKPGEIRLYRGPEILKHPPGPRLSPHDPGLKEALLSAEFSGSGPKEVLLVGAIPETVESGIGLSDAVSDAVPQAVDEVIAELRRLGTAPVPVEQHAEPDIWWER
jgi:hydrogenase maturation protease